MSHAHHLHAAHEGAHDRRRARAATTPPHSLLRASASVRIAMAAAAIAAIWAGVFWATS